MKKLIGIMLAIATIFCSFGVHTIADETTKDVHLNSFKRFATTGMQSIMETEQDGSSALHPA